MKKILSLLCCILFLWMVTSCESSTKFVVSGAIEGAESQTVYLELVDQDKIVMVDSTKTKKKGSFKIRTRVPKLMPEFYRVRIGSEVVNFAVASAEEIKITGTMSNLSTNYTLEASATNQKIREMVLLGSVLKSDIDNVSKAVKSNLLSQSLASDSLDVMVEAYRTRMTGLIIEDPASPAAFFGLFQRFYGSAAFDPYDKADNRIFGAVATSFDMNYPESNRTKYLVNLTLTARKNIQQQSLSEKMADMPISTSIGAFEVSLPDNKGRVVTLSSLKGKSVILCFTAYQLKVSPSLNIHLADIYKRYQAQGVAIYQVSLDADETFWRNAAENLPWVAVRDKRLLGSPYLKDYNVGSLPTLFVINKNGDLVARVEDMNKLEQQLISSL